MLYKKISLMLAAIAIIVGLFCTPFYRYWLSSKFDHEGERVLSQVQHLTPEDRMESRFGDTYLIQTSIKRMLKARNIAPENAMVLLPPSGYIAAMELKNTQFIVPEPAVFYYFTGYKAVATSSPAARTANWVIFVEHHKIVMKHMGNSHFRDSILTVFNTFDH